MKFVIAVHGTRGDVEPAAAIGVELRGRGHDVTMVVPPNLVALFESAGLSPVFPWGPDSTTRVLSWTGSSVDNWASGRGTGAAPRRFPNPIGMLRTFRAYLTDGWEEMSATLTPIAADADLILTGITYQEVAANVAEYYNIPLASLHYFPLRSNTYTLPVRLPKFLVGPVFAGMEWGFGRLLKPAEERQRRTLRLPRAHTRAAKRIVDSGTLEIQLYDEVFFPGLNEEWHGRRPFVGSVTMGMQTNADADVLAWIDAGTPPVYFGFGSTPVESPSELLSMIESVCRELGVRALVNSSGWTTGAANPDSSGSMIKIVEGVQYPAVFPRCRAVVHHGGSGTVAEGIRAGVPTVALWSTADQPVWAARLDALRIGTGRRFSRTTRESLTAAVRTVLSPGYAERVRAVAEQMAKPADAVAKAADLLETHAATARPGSPLTN